MQTFSEHLNAEQSFPLIKYRKYMILFEIVKIDLRATLRHSMIDTNIHPSLTLTLVVTLTLTLFPTQISVWLRVKHSICYLYLS